MAIVTRRRVRRIVGAGVALSVLAGLAACDYPPDGTPQAITITGGPATEDVMGALAASYNADPAYNPDPDNLFNAPSGAAFSPPPDTHCPAPPLYVPPHPDPREMLKQSVTAGDACIDIARTVGTPRPIGLPPGFDLPSFEYYAFALDAVGWSTASPLAPPDLTVAQLQGIYNCTFWDWSQVGGTPGPIRRYWPIPGSPTRTFFQSQVLGFDPTPISTATCPPVINTPENEGLDIQLAGDVPFAIVPFSGPSWVAQARGTVVDRRAGQSIHDLNGRNITRLNGIDWELATPNAADPGAVVREDNVRLINPAPPYPGIRYVFNVVDNTEISYDGAIRYVGFENAVNGHTSPLCSGAKASILVDYGFGPLDNTSGPAPGHNAAGATCRAWP